jgi:hypothetical protein
MEWKSGEEAREHAQAFARELNDLLEKYDAYLETTVHGDAWIDNEFRFNCCSVYLELKAGKWVVQK